MKVKDIKRFRLKLAKESQIKNLEEIFDKKILLIDDIYDSGATIKEIGRYFTKLGAEIIAPLVIAKTVGGDI